MKPRFRIKKLHLKNGNTIYVPQRRHWIFWVDIRDLFGCPERFTKMTSAQEEIEWHKKVDDACKVVGTSYIEYTR